MSKKNLSERDVCTKFIMPALIQAGWDVATQIREEFPLTKGRIIGVENCIPVLNIGSGQRSAQLSSLK